MTSGLSRTGELLVTVCGLGHLRPAPGTWGSIPPAAIMFLLVLLESHWTVPAIALAIVCVVSCLACAVFGDAAEAKYLRKDPSQVVADETAGMCVALTWLPEVFGSTLLAVVLAFLLFRVFDILKLWPADRLQRVPGGWGILLDDLVAGLQAVVVLQILGRLLV